MQIYQVETSHMWCMYMYTDTCSTHCFLGLLKFFRRCDMVHADVFLFRIGQRLLQNATDTEHTHEDVVRLCQLNGVHYRRLQPLLPRDIPLDASDDRDLRDLMGVDLTHCDRSQCHSMDDPGQLFDVARLVREFR